MKNNFHHIGLAKLCGWFGITRQAYYKNHWRSESIQVKHEIVIEKVQQIRQSHIKMGTRKLFVKLQDFKEVHGIKMGRDALFNLLSVNQLLVRKRRRRFHTTDSTHWLRKYPNLIREFTPTGVNQLWVSDITYWKTNAPQCFYITFITDAFSHKIIGYHVAQSLDAIESLYALKMALSALGAESHFQLIHHSDRGLQYCSSLYVSLLKQHDIQISMTEKGDPLENAIAERVNGILKDEYLESYSVNSIDQARSILKGAIDLYNTDRPHMSISNFTPNQIHEAPSSIETKRLWKNYYKRASVNHFQD